MTPIKKYALLLAGACFLAIPAEAGLIVHEPFDYTDGSNSLNAESGGQGFGANVWTVTVNGGAPSDSDNPMEVEASGLSFSTLPISGNHAGRQGTQNRSAAYRTISAASQAALTADNTTIWFSLLVEYNNSASSAAFLFGTQPFGSDTAKPSTPVAACDGFGFTSTSDNINALAFVNSTNQTADDSGIALGSATKLIVGKVNWKPNGTPDELYIFNVTDINSEPVEGAADAQLTADFDQSGFNVISFHDNEESSWDEIRFGSTFADVMGASDPYPICAGESVASNAVPGTLVGGLSMFGTNDSSGFSYTLEEVNDFEAFQITGVTNLRTAVFPAKSVYDINVIGTKGAYTATNQILVAVTPVADEYLIFEVAAEVAAGVAAGGEIVGVLKSRSSDEGVGYELTSGRTDLFTITGQTNLTQIAGTDPGAVGDINYVSIQATNAVVTNSMMVAVEVVSGAVSGTIFLFQ